MNREERERELKFPWNRHNEKGCQKVFWNFVIKGVYIDDENYILDKPYYEEKIIYGTDGIDGDVIFEFKKEFNKKTLERAFGEAFTYLKKFNDEGTIKISKWICISTFNARRYWLIDASKYTNYIYGNELTDTPSESKSISISWVLHLLCYKVKVYIKNISYINLDIIMDSIN
ncbi:hypothetical protein [Metamycoplasma equirhinis]|uniref:hypothetical protein n=1 Tax=Metamycoplasma equirhinis TaxID=92402 RepID=UPI003593E53A